MEQELVELKNELKTQDKIWFPREAEKYWYVNGNGTAGTTAYCQQLDNKWVDNGNYFKTQEEAEKQSEYNKVMNRFRKYVEAYSEPLDWEDENQNKFLYIIIMKMKKLYIH